MRRNRFVRRLARVAILLAALSPALGGAAESGPPAAKGRFILALYEGPDFDDARSHLAEYTAWAESLRRGGAEVGGEEIGGPGKSLSKAGESVRIDAEPESGERLAGYFVLSARDFDDAVRIAETCPHLRHHGRLVVRALAR